MDLLLLVLAPELVRGRGSEEDCERSQERGGGAAQQVTRKGEPRTSLPYTRTQTRYLPSLGSEYTTSYSPPVSELATRMICTCRGL